MSNTSCLPLSRSDLPSFVNAISAVIVTAMSGSHQCSHVTCMRLSTMCSIDVIVIKNALQPVTEVSRSRRSPCRLILTASRSPTIPRFKQTYITNSISMETMFRRSTDVLYCRSCSSCVGSA